MTTQHPTVDKARQVTWQTAAFSINVMAALFAIIAVSHIARADTLTYSFSFSVEQQTTSSVGLVPRWNASLGTLTSYAVHAQGTASAYVHMHAWPDHDVHFVGEFDPWLDVHVGPGGGALALPTPFPFGATVVADQAADANITIGPGPQGLEASWTNPDPSILLSADREVLVGYTGNALNIHSGPLAMHSYLVDTGSDYGWPNGSSSSLSPMVGVADIVLTYTARCPGDFNQSGQLEVADIFAFLNAWFAGNLTADFNASGTLEVADIFAFLNAWFSGCA